jgi:hypothetical protein
MAMSFIILSVLLVLFAILAVYDGFYLHIFKYQLHNHAESRFEHITHTLRAIFFPAIVFFLFVMQDCNTSFFIGITLILLDIIVLGMDAFSETDSRKFMGGLPRWEYILHLFVNGFHFATIALFLALKIKIDDNGWSLIQNFEGVKHHATFVFIAQNLLPGAILIAILHVFTLFSSTKIYWNNLRARVACC